MFGANGLVSRSTPGGGTVFYAFDERGNVAQRTGGSGVVTSTDLYDAFGKKRAGPADVVGFGGQAGYYTEAETGLVLCTNRHYNPQTGRFLTRDPIGYGGGVNLYGYVGNNPINGLDPSGLDWLDNTANFSAGWGDTLSFGFTNGARQYLGVNDGVDQNSGWYHGGEAAGVAQSIAMGSAEAEGANVLRVGMSRPNPIFPRGVEWVERSHWIPKRWLPDSLKDAAWNMKRMWGTDHALADPMRYRFMRRWWKAQNPLPNNAIRQLNRVPDWAAGGSAGALYGAASKAWNGVVGKSGNCH